MPKLSRATGMLAKIRHYVPFTTLLSIYYAIFNSHITYSSSIWGFLNMELRNKLQVLQNKALRIMHFKSKRDSVKALHYSSGIIPINDQIKLQNCLLAFDQQRRVLPSVFNDLCTPVNDIHDHKTKAAKSELIIPRTNSITHGTYSIKTQMAKDWNDIIPKIDIKCIDQCSKFTLHKRIHEFLCNKHKL